MQKYFLVGFALLQCPKLMRKTKELSDQPQKITRKRRGLFSQNDHRCPVQLYRCAILIQSDSCLKKNYLNIKEKFNLFFLFLLSLFPFFLFFSVFRFLPNLLFLFVVFLLHHHHFYFSTGCDSSHSV